MNDSWIQVQVKRQPMTQNRHATFVHGQHISSIYSRHHHSSDDRSAMVAERSVSPQSVFMPNNDHVSRESVWHKVTQRLWNSRLVNTAIGIC